MSSVDTGGGHFERCCLWPPLLKWECHDDSTVKLSLFFVLSININLQELIAFWLQKCCHFILRSKVRTQLRWCDKFYYSCTQHFFPIKIIKKCRNWLRLAKFKLQWNIDCHVFMDHCVFDIHGFWGRLPGCLNWTRPCIHCSLSAVCAKTSSASRQRSRADCKTDCIRVCNHCSVTCSRLE